MNREQLYEKAFRFKKAKPWTLLTERRLFALRMSDGTVEYVSVCGSETPGLILLPGAEDLRYYLAERIAEAMLAEEEDDESYPFELGHLVALQDNLICFFDRRKNLPEEEREAVAAFCRKRGIRLSGKNAYPLFYRKRAGRVPACIQTEQDEERLCEALDAAVWLAEHPDALPGGLEELDADSGELPILSSEGGGYAVDMLPIPPARGPVFPRGDSCNEANLARVRKLRKRGVWHCAVGRLLSGTEWFGDDIPVQPAVLAVVEIATGERIPVQPTADYETRTDVMLNVFMDAILRRGARPSKIVVSDDRTWELLCSWCSKAGIALERRAEPSGELSDVMAELDVRDMIAADDSLLAEMSNALSKLASEGILDEESMAFLSDMMGGEEDMPDAGWPPDMWNELPPLPAKQKAKRKQAPAAAKRGSFLISVSLGSGCYRHIRIGRRALLSDLSDAILGAFAFADDHAHAFFMDNKLYSQADCYYMAGLDPLYRATNQYHLYETEMAEGKKFKYFFDFGDSWVFQCRVLRELAEESFRAEVVRQKGDAPPQYGYFEDDDDDDEDDGEDD